MNMRDNLLRWGTVVGAMPRILNFYERLKNLSSYERLRFCNSVLGPDWAFRLLDIAGEKAIAASRPSWLAFYRDDIYGLHMPLDPRAPETDKYLGSDMGAKEYAFYCGMGFDGYLLALNTPRIVDEVDLSVSLAGQRFHGLDVSTLRQMAAKKLAASDYYSFYGDALNALFNSYNAIVSGSRNDMSEKQIEDTAAASLVFLCGGHQGCGQHVDEAEGQSTRLSTIILCRYAKALASGEISFSAVQALERAA